MRSRTVTISRHCGGPEVAVLGSPAWDLAGTVPTCRKGGALHSCNSWSAYIWSNMDLLSLLSCFFHSETLFGEMPSEQVGIFASFYQIISNSFCYYKKTVSMWIFTWRSAYLCIYKPKVCDLPVFECLKIPPSDRHPLGVRCPVALAAQAMCYLPEAWHVLFTAAQTTWGLLAPNTPR